MDDMQIVELHNGAEGVEVVEQVGEQEFSEALQGVGKDEFCNIVGSQFTPFVGQEFTELEEAIRFYKVYALSCGFDVRKYTTKKWRDGTIKSKLLVCNRQGCTYAKKVSQDKEKEICAMTKEGEAVVEDKQRRSTKVRRIGCEARLRLFLLNGTIVVDRFHAGHNHELVDVKDREFLKLSRRLHKYHKQLILYNSRLKIGATKTYKMCKEHANGFENIGASLNDFKNFQRDVKCYINERDGQLFIDRFKNMAETREDFYFDYEVDVDNSLLRAIWADGVGRRNYEVFGDGVSFDPTYSTNKYDMVFTPFTGVDNHKRSVTFCGALLFRENEESFTWVFRRFLEAMGGKEPEYIITDQDLGIIKGVSNVFKKARHRFCMWHIMNKVPVKYGSTSRDYPDFIKKLNAIVWDEDIEAEEFDNRWCEIMAEHPVRKEKDWFDDIYAIRRQWVMAHCRVLNMGTVMRTTQRSESENSFFKRFENNSGLLVEFWMRFESAIDQQRHTYKKLQNDNRHTSPKLVTKLPIESHGAKVYTHEVFEVFQEEVSQSTSGLSVCGFTEAKGLELTKLKDVVTESLFDIQYNPATYEATCTCRMMERSGLLCRHIIVIYSSHGIKEIPVNYIARRWTKDAVRGTSDDMNIIDGREIEMTKLWSEVYETIGLLKGRDKADVESLTNLIKDFKEKLWPSVEELTKHQEIEQLLGCNPIKEITILPPKQAKNKGTGRRMLSSRTKAIMKAAKPKRMCNNCKEMAHHDKRNCPNPFAEFPPTRVDSVAEEEDNEVEEDE